MNWYYASHGTQQGPASEEQLAQLVREGAVSGSTLIWKDGMPDWLALSVVRPDLLADLNAAPQIGGASIDPAQKDLVVQQMREGLTPSTPGNLNYAGFWIRLVAKFIDGLIMGVFFLAIFLLFFMDQFTKMVQASSTPGAEPNPDDAIGMIVMQVVMTLCQYVVAALYNGFCVSKWGRYAWQNGSWPQGRGRRGQRAIERQKLGPRFADLINNFTCTIGYVIAAFDDQKRALHDHICNTRVIKTR
jgi:uncharacterized RDD family membrane protein YckC